MGEVGYGFGVAVGLGAAETVDGFVALAEAFLDFLTFLGALVAVEAVEAEVVVGFGCTSAKANPRHRTPRTVIADNVNFFISSPFLRL